MPTIGQTTTSQRDKRLSTRTEDPRPYDQSMTFIDLVAAVAAAPNLRMLDAGDNPIDALDLAPLARRGALESGSL